MTTYCKTLHPQDYQVFHEAQHADYIYRIIGMPAGHGYHPHRNWEYGLTLHALREQGAVTVLDVGGGGSVLAPAAAVLGMSVIEVDPDDYEGWVRHQAAVFDKPIEYRRCDFMNYVAPYEFDAVTSISVLEHVPKDADFFRKLASHVKPGGLLVITVDFWPDGEKHNPMPGQLRCYNESMLRDLVDSVEGFSAVGPWDYSHAEAYVNQYTFAGLVLKRDR